VAAKERPEFVSGFVSILGRPNSGKSTLLNALVKTRLAIVSDKPQTTRTAVQGVWTQPGAQVVFLDTPGIHHGDTLINRRMMESVRAALKDRDLLLLLADCTHRFADADARAVELLAGHRTPALLALNKVDRLADKRALLPLIERYHGLGAFQACIPISALTGVGLDTLRDAIVARLPPGPRYFPDDYLTDQPERFLAAELIREQVLRQTGQEVPHAAAVVVDLWEETPALTRIAATVYVERGGQKGIVIGAAGARLKQIGTRARLEMEALLGKKIFLELFVKVRPRWRQSPEFLNAIDWRSMSGDEGKTA